MLRSMGKLATLGVVLGLAAAGCGSSSSSTCEAVGDHMAKVAKQQGDDDPDGMKAEIVSVCKEQKWSDEVRKCMVGVKEEIDIAKCLAMVAEFETYIAKSKTSEAREFVKKLYDGARSYYMDPGGGGITPIPPQFPAPSVGPTPPLGECCKQGGKCAPERDTWEAPTWTALMFAVDDPHYYSYQYEVVDPAKKFVVRAFGDLDCDGVYSTFEMTGEINAEFSDGPAGSAALFREQELE